MGSFYFDQRESRAGSAVIPRRQSRNDGLAAESQSQIRIDSALLRRDAKQSIFTLVPRIDLGGRSHDTATIEPFLNSRCALRYQRLDFVSRWLAILGGRCQ